MTDEPQKLKEALAGMSTHMSAAFDLFHELYPDYTPKPAQLKSIAYLLGKYGADKIMEWGLAAATRDIEPAGLDRYIWGCSRNTRAQV